MTPIIIALLVLAAFAFVNLIRAAQPTYNERAVWLWKPLATIAVIALCAMSLWRVNHNLSYTMTMLVALVFCLIGDVMLIPKHSSKGFIFGLAAFLVAHVLLSVLWNGAPTNVMLAIILGALSVAGFLLLRSGAGKLQAPVLIYVAVITFMVYNAWSAYLASFATWTALIAAGALLFYISDFVLALNKFVYAGNLPRQQLIVLSTYYAAITLFALSASFV
jgi:uncharacterized membrane protein YhhN